MFWGKTLMQIIPILCLFLSYSSFAKDAPLQCDIGPITKIYGSAQWLLYSCTDGKSLVIVSAPGSPAAPFYFYISLQGDGYHLWGEGSGSKAVTDSAVKELQALGKTDIEELVGQTIRRR